MQNSASSDFTDVVTHTIDRESCFFKQLTASYQCTTSISAARNNLLHDERVDLGEGEVMLDLQHVIDCSEPSLASRPQETLQSSGISPELAFEPIYKPSGKWEWMSGCDIVDDEETFLSEGALCSAYIKKGEVNGKKITYVCKSWRTNRDWCNAFYSELALYKTQLRSLQGSVVPSVMSVFTGPCSINVAMEPPHHSFWIEASTDVPLTLKDRCVEAYAKLHACGVCHGDVELRHMLIGGDAKVTIIDFQESTALEPNEAVGLRCATEAELRKEMRKVKVKLDYPGARAMELEKRRRCMARKRKNEEETWRATRQPGYTAVLQDALEEDVLDPPIVSSQEWDDWIRPSPYPRRFVVPGQTQASLRSEIRRFLDLLERKSQAEDPSYFPHPPSSHDGTLPSESVMRMREDALSWRPWLSSPGQSRRSSQKRRAELDIDPAKNPTKRPRPDTVPPAGIFRVLKLADNRPDERLVHDSGELGGVCDRARAIQTNPSFSSQVTQTAPDASLVPHNVFENVPPRNSSSTSDRIKMQNLGECALLELPHPTLLKLFPQHPRWRDPDLQLFTERRALRRQSVIELARRHPEQSFKLPTDHRSLGALKRCVNNIQCQLDLSVPEKQVEESFDDLVPHNAERAQHVWCARDYERQHNLPASAAEIGRKPGRAAVRFSTTHQVIPGPQMESNARLARCTNVIPWYRSWMQKVINLWI